MVTFTKYKKKTVIVAAGNPPETMNLGDLGTLTSLDWILQLASGALHSMDAVTFPLKYERALETADLTGTDWD